MKKNLTKIIMMALCLCMMIAVFTVAANAEAAAEKPADIDLSKAEVTLSEYYSFFDGKEKDFPTVTVTVDGKVVDPKCYTVTWTTAGEGNVTKARDAAAYAVTVTAKEDSGYTGTKAPGKTETSVRYHVINVDAEKAVTVKVNPWVYGDAEKGKVVITYANENYKTTIVEYYSVDGKTMTKLDKVPVNAGKYAVKVVELNANKYSEVVEKFEILPKEITVTMGNKTVEYGNDAELTWTVPEGAIVKGDDLGFVATRDEGEMVGTYAITGTAANKNYEVTVKNAEYTITQRVVELDWDKVLTFNGETQTPNVWVKNLVDGDVCEVEIFGGARKYAGKYSVKVVALGNDNYKLADGDAMVVEYEIVENADGEGDREAAVDKFVGIVDSITNNVEVAAPVVEVITNVGNAIWGGIKAGFQALVSDFFGRVFG